MSVTERETGVDHEVLNRAGATIADALDVAGERIDPHEVERAQQELDRIDERLRLGVDHTVVALVGGTGSGKSSLFNAISGLDFADVGVLRPTTAQAAACTWGSPAQELLDFLEVSTTRRIQRDSVLDRESQAELHGLVLLDLPDHDSVERGHARQVDRLLPLVDLLIWVVDPQKYADNVLHERYLRVLAQRQSAMLVVVNQIDTIPAGTREQVRDDVAQLLAYDGLNEVQIMLTSVRQNSGIDDLRVKVADVAKAASVSARTARAQLESTAARLRQFVAADQPQRPEADVTAERVAEAAGVSAVADSIHAAVASPRSVALSQAQAPARSRLDAIRSRWLDSVTRNLPRRWAASVRADIPESAKFADDVWQALSGVSLPDSSERQATTMRRIGLGALALAVVAVVLAALFGFGDGAAGPWAFVIAGAVAAGAGGVLLTLARHRRQQAALDRSAAYRTAALGAIREVVIRDLLEPTDAPLREHNRVREALLSVGVGEKTDAPESAAPADSDSPTAS